MNSESIREQAERLTIASSNRVSTRCGSEFYLKENKEGWTEIAQVATVSANWDKTIETPIVLVTHVPLLTSFFQATAGHEQATPRNRVVVNHREVLACFAKHRLHLVLQGHPHVNEMLRWRGTTFITGGAVASR